MAEEVTLPQLGESVTEGTITAWLVDEGESVEEDEPLFEISTDKIDTEVPSPASGVLQEIRAQVDDTVEVGEVVAIIASEDEAETTAEPEGGGEEGAEDAAPEEAPAEEEEEAPAEEAPAEDEEEAATEEAEEAAAAAEAPEETAEAAEAEAGEAAEPERRAEPETPEPSAGGDGQAEGKLLSPIVRKMVDEHDLDVSEISGSGKGGRITREDVEQAVQSGTAKREKKAERAAPAKEERPAAAAAAEAPQPRKPAQIEGRQRTEKLSRIRSSIAKHMYASLQTTAQLTAGMEVDVTRIMRLREDIKDEFKQREGVSLSPLPFFARAVCMVLPDHPSLNSAIDVQEGTATYYQIVNLGIAVDTEAGLIVPNIKHADDLTVPALARQISDLAERARSRKLQPDDVAGGTFTITNTGSRGVLFDTPILNPPEVAILATPKIEKRPVVLDDGDLGETIAIRHMTYLCLTYDHRMVDGADAARFLADLKETIETHDWSSEARA